MSVSQWQVQGAQGISEAFLLPVLALIIAQFSFVVQGFHSDNGSEYINRQVVPGGKDVRETARRTDEITLAPQ